MRLILGIFIGLLLAAGVLWGCGYWFMHLHPPPAGLDYRPSYELTQYFATAPQGALWLLATVCGLAALIGGGVAAWIARGHRGAAALTIATPLMLMVIAGAALVPQPDWVPVLGMLLPIPLALAGWRMAIPRAEV